MLLKLGLFVFICIINGIARLLKRHNISSNYANVSNALGNIMLKYNNVSANVQNKIANIKKEIQNIENDLNNESTNNPYLSPDYDLDYNDPTSYNDPTNNNSDIKNKLDKILQELDGVNTNNNAYQNVNPSSPASYFLSLFNLLANEKGYLNMNNSWLSYWIVKWLGFYNLTDDSSNKSNESKTISLDKTKNIFANVSGDDSDENEYEFFLDYAHYKVVGGTNLGGKVTTQYVTNNDNSINYTQPWSYFNIQDVILNLTFNKTIDWAPEYVVKDTSKLNGTDSSTTYKIQQDKPVTYTIEPNSLTISDFVKNNIGTSTTNNCGLYLNQKLDVKDLTDNDAGLKGLIFDINFNGYVTSGAKFQPFGYTNTIWNMESQYTINWYSNDPRTKGDSNADDWYANSTYHDASDTSDALYWKYSILSESLPWSYVLAHSYNLLPTVYQNNGLTPIDNNDYQQVSNKTK